MALGQKTLQIIKAITWRIIASGTTFVLALLIFSEDPNAAEKATWVAIIESALKILFYYLHERAWYRLQFGAAQNDNKE